MRSRRLGVSRVEPREPVAVIPPPLARAVADLPYWFVIGGQAMRCYCPYRPSRDVDFGVTSARDLDDLVQQLQRRGHVEIAERTSDTVHLRFDGIDVSIFVLEMLAAFVHDRRLSVTGLLATKLHAILDRGTRRDFFDLYVTLHRNAMGIAECLAAVRQVYRQDVNDTLLLRALTYLRRRRARGGIARRRTGRLGHGEAVLLESRRPPADPTRPGTPDRATSGRRGRNVVARWNQCLDAGV